MKKADALLLVLFTAVSLSGCGGLNFSQTSPEAKDFSPSSVAVLPATVGEHESSRSIIDEAVSKKLKETGAFEAVTDGSEVAQKLASSAEVANSMEGYIQKLNTLGISDAAASAKLGDSLQTDALFLTYVTSWGYGRQEGNKIARVGLGIRLVNASTGTVVWKANHELTEEYWMIKPDLAGLSEKLLSIMLKEIPVKKSSIKKGAKPAASAAPAPKAPALEPVAGPEPSGAPAPKEAIPLNQQ